MAPARSRIQRSLARGAGREAPVPVGQLLRCVPSEWQSIREREPEPDLKLRRLGVPQLRLRELPYGLRVSNRLSKFHLVRPTVTGLVTAARSAAKSASAIAPPRTSSRGRQVSNMVGVVMPPTYLALQCAGMVTAFGGIPTFDQVGS